MSPWSPAYRSAAGGATTNPFGITLDRAWTDWAAQHGVSETIAAALYLVSRNRKADEVVVKLTPGELERVKDFFDAALHSGWNWLRAHG
jgi:hypothetical protein